MARVGFAGLGIMGSRMAANLQAKGLLAGVYNRGQQPARRFAELGVPSAASPAELARGCEVVMTCLADPAAVREAWLGREGIVSALRPGMRGVDFSTVDPGLSRELEVACRGKGAAFLESPVTGSKQGAQDATLLLMTGGEKALHDELEPLLLNVGKKAIYVGQVGAASSMKLIGNTIIGFMLEGMAEGLTLGKKLGVAPEKVLEVVQASGFASPYWAFKGGAMIRRDFDTHFSLDLLHKDQRLALAEADAHRVAMPGLAALHQVCTAARARGIGGEDISAIIKVVEALSGLG